MPFKQVKNGICVQCVQFLPLVEEKKQKYWKPKVVYL